MRTTISIVAIVLSFSLTTRAAEPIRVACVGDSITEGWGLPHPPTDSYPAQLQDQLGHQYRVGNFGHSGATLAKDSNPPYWTQPEFAKALAFKPQIVVIMLGTNDAHPSRWDKVKDEFVPTMKELIGRFRELTTRPRVFVCLPVPSFEGRKYNIETGVIPLVRQACREADATTIDLFTPLADRKELFPDKLHPDFFGAGLMAAVVYHAISDPVMKRKNNWNASSDSEQPGEGLALHAIDGNPDTYWHTAYDKVTPKHPHELVVNLGKIQSIIGSFMARKTGDNGRIRDYQLLAAARSSPELIAKGTFTGRSEEEIVFLKQPVSAQFLTLRALSEVNNGPWTSLAEFDVLTAPAAKPTASQSATTQSAVAPNKTSFEIGDTDFLLNGKPFVIRSGEMHAARVPREYWRHRLEMIRAMGCNTVCAYLFWNQHEPRPGEFTFSGDADAAEYCRLAQQVGLKVILRPGPYSCAEWDLGGIPWWLLKHENIKLRTRDPRYLDAAKKYLHRVGKELAPLQITRGGPIIMVQVENEYGSYGDDKEYIRELRDSLRDAGFDVPLFTCDGPSQLKNDTLDDTFCVVNFGSNPEANFKALREIRPKGPLMCGEYYPGWFDSWGTKHHTGDTARIVRELGSMLENRQSFSIYMVHGGTSFGMTAGANSPPFRPQSTSYDYDAPIDEAGRATPKFHALRKLFAKHLNEGESIPEIPPPPAEVISVPDIRLATWDSLLESLSGPPLEWMGPQSVAPLPMEMLDQASGAIVYRTELPAGPAGELVIREPQDLAQVFIDSKRVGSVDRRWKSNRVPIDARAEPAQLHILVEAFGRVNFGSDLHDRKGITDRVELIVNGRIEVLSNWWHYYLPMDSEWLRRLRFERSTSVSNGPSVYYKRFSLKKAGDTFIDMRGWKRGMVWVNGHNLGRYWNIGPQQTLYCPGCWLTTEFNDITVLDYVGGVEKPIVRGLDSPILDELREDPDAPKPLRRAGQTLSLGHLKPAGHAIIEAGDAWQKAEFESVKGRYVCIEALDSQNGDAFTTCAELRVVDGAENEIPLDRCRVIYADSEELSGDDGLATNVLDGKPNTFWHTQWQGGSPKHPHFLVIDLGREESISGVRILPRQHSPNGRMKSIRVYVSADKFKGL